MGNTVGLYCFTFSAGIEAAQAQALTPITAYRKVLWQKSNPRSEQYMRDLFFERYPDGEFVVVQDGESVARRLAGARQIVLLYPDAIGLGFGGVETAALRVAARSGMRVRALNGRRREFELDGRALRALRLRRVLERYMLGELAITIGFIMATPFLVFADFVRGKR
jgi:hypothetical protein